MSSQFKKIFSVALALVLGLGIIFFAWGRGASLGNKVSFEPTINSESWKDSLLTSPQTSLAKIKSVAQKEQEATTTTDIVGREFLVNYGIMLQSRATTTLSDADTATLAQMFTAKIEPAQRPQYTRKDLNISEDNSSEATTVYATSLTAALHIFSTSQTKSDLDIIFELPGEKDDQKLAELAQDISRYKKLERALLSLKTPSGVAPLHLRLVQSYANMGNDIKIMADFFNDPLKGLGALAQYRRETQTLGSLAEEYRTYLSKNN